MNVKNINQNSENIIDNNGYVSIVEAFNYAVNRDSRNENPLYDDNGNRDGWEAPIPHAQDGNLGMNTYV